LYDITLGEFGMEDRLKKTRNMTLADRGLRLLVAGGTILLFLIVLVDAFGARSRAVAAMERARTQPPVEETRTATVPSVYSVPRDLASEAAMQRQLAAAAPAEEALEEVAAPEVAEAEATEEAPQDLVAEEAVEDAAEPEVAQAEATEDAAEPEVAETQATEDAPQDLAAEEAAEEAAEPEVAEAEATEDAPQDMAADDATEDDALVLLASADIANGENVWRQCRACHVHDAEQNRGGPYLLNIIGREIGVAEGWRYSRALAEHDGVWTVEALLAWLENPDTYIPGNQMAFRGLRNEQDRIDVLGFLNASRTN
jgi:cytochrome c2